MMSAKERFHSKSLVSRKNILKNILLTAEDEKNTGCISKILQNKNIFYKLIMFVSEVAPASFYYSKHEMITRFMETNLRKHCLKYDRILVLSDPNFPLQAQNRENTELGKYRSEKTRVLAYCRQ